MRLPLRLRLLRPNIDLAVTALEVFHGRNISVDALQNLYAQRTPASASCVSDPYVASFHVVILLATYVT